MNRKQSEEWLKTEECWSCVWLELQRAVRSVAGLIFSITMGKSEYYEMSDLLTYSITIVTSVPWDMGKSTASSIDAYGKNYGKNYFSSSTEAYFNHAVITVRDWFV